MAAAAFWGLCSGWAGAQPGWVEAEGWEDSAEHADSWQELVRPGEDESRWLEVPWLTSVWEARELAAAQGKPIFLWAGSGGGPVGVC